MQHDLDVVWGLKRTFSFRVILNAESSELRAAVGMKKMNLKKKEKKR